MILVLEGACGSGKSTVAKVLSATLGWPIYRAFRTLESDHEPQEAAWAKKLRLPINTWMEDLFAADVFAATKPDLILDRSMPSAIAYEIMNLSKAPITFRLHSASQTQTALEVWASLMRRASARIVVLKAPSAELIRRLKARNAVPEDPATVGREQLAIERCARITRLPTLPIVSKGLSTQLAAKIQDWLGGPDAANDAR